MPWSITIARIAGTEIRIHLTFLLLLLWIGIAQYLDGGTAQALDGVLFVVAVFACVVLHELGHALAARRYGIATPDITLLPIGGIANLSRIPDNPTEEIVIAFAGPLVNVVIAAILVVPLGLRVGPMLLTSHGLLPEGLANTPSLNTLLVWLFAANVSLVLFNLIPAFPLDGGRMLRALLAMFMGLPRATRAASAIGQLIAVGLGVYAVLSGHFILALVALTTITGVGLNILLGLTGQVSLGHVGFYSIGAYIAAILTLHGVSFWIAFPVAGLIAGLVGGLTSSRRRNPISLLCAAAGLKYRRTNGNALARPATSASRAIATRRFCDIWG